MPKGFKLPSDNPKFDGLQDPKIWLEDHISFVRLHGGSRSTTMQCLQLQLQGAARAWLNNLPRGSTRSWDELVYSFVCNFKGTYKIPASIEELRCCQQKSGESLRSYIQRWSIIKNSTENISEDRAIDAFNGSVRRMELREELGRSKPQTIDHLMEIANRWADGEDLVKNHVHSDDEAELERRRDRRSKRRMRIYDDHDDVNMVAAGYADRRDDNGNNGYC